MGDGCVCDTYLCLSLIIHIDMVVGGCRGDRVILGRL